MKSLYTAEVTVQGGREGHARSSDGRLDIDLSVPKEMGGPDRQGTNPEQLFATGYAACFESALRLVARNQGKSLSNTSITARVTLHMDENKQYLLSVALQGKIEGFSQQEILELMRAAHQVCPYSHATRGNIKVDLTASS